MRSLRHKGKTKGVIQTMQVHGSAFLKEARPLMKELAARLGTEYRYCSVLAQDDTGYSLAVSARGITAGEDRTYTARGFVARVADNKGYAEYSFNHLTEENIGDVVDTVRGALIPLAEGLPAEAVFREPEIWPDQAMEDKRASGFLLDPDEMPEGKLAKRLTEMREQALALDERIIDCGVRMNWQHIHKLYVSASKDIEQDLLWTCGSISMMASRGQEIKVAYDGVSDLGGAEILDELSVKVPGVKDTVIALLDSEPIVPGEYECVCTPSVTGMIVHEAFGHGVEMDMFVKDRAMAKYCVGDRVASDLVTMHDGALTARQTGSFFFDDEGCPPSDTVIIEKGILKRGISDLLSARALGTEPTGNGRRESFRRKAYTRMTNTWFEGGTDSVEDMIASVKYGFLLDMPESGMEDPKNWGIQMMVAVAREIRDGRFTGKIFSPIVMTGFVPDLLKSITMMSPDVELEGGGYCGKGHKEWVKVSDGGPYIKARIRLG